jgi:hypothetical protein
MGLIYKSKVKVDKVSVEMNNFVEDFIARTCEGMVHALKGVDKVDELSIRKNKDDMKISVNGNEIPLTPFPNDIIRNTLTALVCSLKGIERVDSFDIEVEVK